MDFNEKEAKVEYLDGSFNVIEHGTYVVCSVSKKRIPLPDLKYWSVVRQEAYYDAKNSLIREKQIS